MPVVTVVTAQVVALAAGIVGSVAGLIWWQALLLAAAAAGVCLLPVQRRTLLDWARTLIRYRTRMRVTATETTDFIAPDGTVIGVCATAGTVCTVIEMQPVAGSVTRLGRDGVDEDHPLPLRTLTESLVQHDISLAGIDIVAHGRRTDPEATVASVYDELVGPLAATAHRTVWLVARFHATGDVAAVARRGGGGGGAVRVVAVAAQRIVRALQAAGSGSRILPASEIRTVRAAIAGDDEPGRPAWTHVPVPNGHNTGYSIDPRALGTALLCSVWATRSLSTIVTVRLRPGPSPSEVRIAASCRLTTTELPERLRLPGLTPTIGREAEALRSHLPGAPASLDALTSFAVADAGRLDALTMPVAGCGQLIGSDAEGRGVAVRVVGPDIDVVNVVGELYLAQQVVLRAVATGARLAVLTTRPQFWRPFVSAVADPARLVLTDGAAPLAPEATAVVLDGVGPVPLPRSVTAIRVHESLTPTEGAAVSILQPGGHGNRIILWANGTRRDLTLVTIAAETAFLGRPATEPAPAR
ncbi:type VII secretion protein EccE [Rhodococcus sp. NPDC003348]